MECSLYYWRGQHKKKGKTLKKSRYDQNGYLAYTWVDRSDGLIQNFVYHRKCPIWNRKLGFSDFMPLHHLIMYYS